MKGGYKPVSMEANIPTNTSLLNFDEIELSTILEEDIDHNQTYFDDNPMYH